MQWLQRIKKKTIVLKKGNQRNNKEMRQNKAKQRTSWFKTHPKTNRIQLHLQPINFSMKSIHDFVRRHKNFLGCCQEDFAVFWQSLVINFILKWIGCNAIVCYLFLGEFWTMMFFVLFCLVSFPYCFSDFLFSKQLSFFLILSCHYHAHIWQDAG